MLCRRLVGGDYCSSGDVRVIVAGSGVSCRGGVHWTGWLSMWIGADLRPVWMAVLNISCSCLSVRVSDDTSRSVLLVGHVRYGTRIVRCAGY